MPKNLTVQTTLKAKLPRLPFPFLKRDVLGDAYMLSIVFIGDARSRHLNGTYRGKSKPANVLSFPLSPNEGELFINPHEAARDAHAFNMSTHSFIALLVIHGMLHLKGYDHGSTMEKKEAMLMKKYIHRDV